MPATPLAPVWCAPTNVLNQRPQRIAATTEIRPRLGRLTRPSPYGPSWCGGQRYHRVRYTILDAETSRLSQLGQEPWNTTSQDELFAPRPARTVLSDLAHMGAVFETSDENTVFVSSKAYGRGGVQNSNCSPFVRPNLPSRPQGRATGPLYGSVQQQHPVTREESATGASGDASNIQNRYIAARAHDASQARDQNFPGHEARSGNYSQLSLGTDVSGNVLLQSPTTEEFPDFWYGHNPVKYAGYKRNCSRGYSNITAFVRHSLDKHFRQGNVRNEGISMEQFQAAQKVKVPASVPKEQKSRQRYLLVRQQLFGTAMTDPIPVCEGEGTHPIIPGKRSSHENGSRSVENGKRRRSRTTSPESTGRARADYRESGASAFLQATEPRAPLLYSQQPQGPAKSEIPIIAEASLFGEQREGNPTGQPNIDAQDSRGRLEYELHLTTTSLGFVHQSLSYDFALEQDIKYITEFRTLLEYIQRRSRDLSTRVITSRDQFLGSIDLGTQSEGSCAPPQPGTPSFTQETPTTSMSMTGNNSGHKDGMPRWS